MEVLQEYIEPENLPPCIAPNEGRAGAIPGYFEKVSLEGGPLIKQVKPVNKMGNLKRDTSLTSVTTVVSSEGSGVSVSNVSGKRLMAGFWDEALSVVTARPVANDVSWAPPVFNTSTQTTSNVGVYRLGHGPKLKHLRRPSLPRWLACSGLGENSNQHK